MPFNSTPGNFDHTTLAVMRQAFDEVCTMLVIRAEDVLMRERIASAIIAGANAGEDTRDGLREYAMRSLAPCRVD